MPILYEPPQPFAPSISASYGQAEQFDRIAPLLAQQQIANQHAQLQAAAIGQQGAIAAGHQMMQEEQFRQGLYQHGYDAAAGRNLAAAEADARIRAAPELARQHAELSAWLSNQEMTQAENMRMQRMQGAVGEVIQGMKEGRFSQEDGENMLMQLKTGIDGYKQRQEKAAAQHAEMQSQMLNQALARQKAAEVENQQFEAMLKQQGHGVMNWTDPDGKRHLLIQNPRTGEWYNPVRDSHGGEGAGGAKDRAFEYKQEQDVRKEWHDAHKRAREQVDAWSKEKYKDANGKEHYRYGNLAQSDEARQAWTNILMAESGMDPNLETHVRKRLGKPMPGSGSEGQPGGGPPSGGGERQGGPPAMTPEAARETWKPFDPNRPGAGNPDQQVWAQGFQQKLVEFEGREDLPPETRMRAQANIRYALSLLSEYGSYQGMPPDKKALYDKSQAFVNSLPKAPSGGGSGRYIDTSRAVPVRELPPR